MAAGLRYVEVSAVSAASPHTRLGENFPSS
jgi:hypothetical protein